MPSIQGIGLAVKKREVSIGGLSFSRRMRKERIEGWYHGTMEFIEIKSKKEHT